MKIKSVFLVAIIMLLIGAQNSVAWASTKYFYSDRWHLYTADPVILMVNNEKIYTDVPPIIVNERTIVPARAVFEKLGAQVTWNEEKREVTVSDHANKVVMNIDNRDVLVNGKLVSIQAPDPAPMIVADVSNTGRTMLPVRFVSDHIGYDVDWDVSKRTVLIDTKSNKQKSTDSTQQQSTKPSEPQTSTSVQQQTPISAEPQTQQSSEAVNSDFQSLPTQETEIKDIYHCVEKQTEYVGITMSMPKKPKAFLLENPARLVLDFQGAKLNLPGERLEVNTAQLEAVRYAVNQPGNIRIVLDLTKNVNYDIIETEDGYNVILGENGGAGNREDGDEEKGDEDDQEDDDAAIPATKVKTDIGGRLVVLDPGHGGKDPGALGRRNDEIILTEAEVNLDVGLQVQKLLKAAGVNVVMTREKDVYVGLTERCEFANQRGADLFVSIHNNSISSPDVGGTMTMFYNGGNGAGKSMTSEKAAGIMQKELMSVLGRKDRGLVDGSRLVVLKGTSMTAILTEGAFLSNDEELTLLCDGEFRKKMAQGIAEGIINILNAMVDTEDKGGI